MPAIYEQYSDELRSEFDYLSTWLPNAHVELGDVGRLHRDRFERLTCLGDLGIPFTAHDRQRGVDLDYSSAANIGVRTGVAADAIVATARINVSFSREHGMVFQALSCRITEIVDRSTLGTQVLKRAQVGRWPADQVVITEVVSTGPAVVLVSQQRDASIDVTADADLSGPLPLASASGRLKVIYANGIGVKIIAPDGLTPLFRVSGLRRRLFGSGTFGRRGGLSAATDDTADDTLVFAELTYEDLGT